MKKYGKVILIFVVILCVGIGLTYKFVKAGSKETAAEHYFDVEGREYLQNMTTYSTESYDYEGYLISLDSSIYDEATNVAYCVFSIKQKDGKTDFLKDGANKWFGENNRFTIETMLSGTIHYEQKLDGDTLYYYFNYSAHEQPEEFKGKLYLVDGEKNENISKGPTEHVFHLIGSDSREYRCGESAIYLSPICMSVNFEKEIVINTISLNYKNGKQKVIVKEGNTSAIVSAGDGSQKVAVQYGNTGAEEGTDGEETLQDNSAEKYEIWKYQFYTAINITEVDSIIVNDMIFKSTESE